jgi:hypothetical protein
MNIFKFRRKKGPLKVHVENRRIHERCGRVLPCIHGADAGRRKPVEPPPVVEAPRPVCELCKQPLTLEDNKTLPLHMRNMDVIELNKRFYPVHKICPPEVKGG